MDNQLVWKEEYNIGVDVIDKEHQRLFKIINKLFAFGKEEKKSQWICQEGIKYFKEHAIKHFTDEEKTSKHTGIFIKAFGKKHFRRWSRNWNRWSIPQIQ